MTSSSQRILVPLDFSDLSEEALAVADGLAAASGGRLSLVNVYQVTEIVLLDYSYVQSAESVAEICDAARDRLERWAKELKTPRERVSIAVRVGDPADEIVAMSGDHDLVVMPTHGRKGVSRFLLGSVAEKVVRGAKCSVYVVRSRQPGSA